MIISECLDYCSEQFANIVSTIVGSFVLLLVSCGVIGAVALIAYVFTKKDDNGE